MQLGLSSAPDWVRAVEDIALTKSVRGARVIGFLSGVPDAGEVAVCRTMAELFGKANQRCLFLDISQSGNVDSSQPLWATETRPYFEEITLRTTEQSRHLFDDPSWCQDKLGEVTSGFDRILVALPCIHRSSALQISPVPPAESCDAVLLVASRGRFTRDDVTLYEHLKATTNIRFFGVIVTQSDYRSVGQEIAGTIRKYGAFFPKFAGSLGKKVENAAILQ